MAHPADAQSLRFAARINPENVINRLALVGHWPVRGPLLRLVLGAGTGRNTDCPSVARALAQMGVLFRHTQHPHYRTVRSLSALFRIKSGGSSSILPPTTGCK